MRFTLFLCSLLVAATAYAADTKVTNLTDIGTIATGDLFYCVDDPAGTPASRQCTVDQIADFAASDTLTLINKTIDGDDNTLQDILYSQIKASSRSGSDVTLVTGTAGTNGDLSVWNADGDLIDGPTPPAGDIVGTTDSQTLTNKTLTTPVISAISNTGTVTLPTATTTLIGADTTNTLTNKTFDANGTGNSLSNVETADIASGSKSGSDTDLITGTAGTNGDLVIWNGDGDAVDGPTPPSGTIVGTSDTQTLTNKTINCANNTCSGYTESHCFALSDETTDIATGTAVVTTRWPYAFTVTGVRASVNDASSSGLVTVDINDGGTTIMSTNKLTIDATEETSTTAATAAGVTDSAFADDAEITFDIDGAGADAKGLKVCVIGRQ